MAHSPKQINLPTGDQLHAILRDFAKQKRRYLTSLIWEAVAEKYPELEPAITEDRLR